MTGFKNIKSVKNYKVDYSEYLGPDWNASWDDAPILISNHISFIDDVLAIIKYHPSFIARASIKQMPAIGILADSLNCIYIDRFGKDSKQSKI